MLAATMDQILDALDAAEQRATYGAVASLVGVSPRTLMKGRVRSQRDSWIVNLRSGLPTDYDAGLLHPALMANTTVLTTRDELAQWLTSRDVDVTVERAG